MSEQDAIEHPATEQASAVPAWKAPLLSMGALWQKHVASRFPEMTEEEAAAPEIIEIPVDDLGKGLLDVVKVGLSPVASLGNYSVKGIQYAAKDSAELVRKGFSKARDIAASRKAGGCDGCETGCGEQGDEEIIDDSGEEQVTQH